MLVNGVWIDNITCPRCRRRHPAELSCDSARLSAESTRRKRQQLSESDDTAVEQAMTAPELRRCPVCDDDPNKCAAVQARGAIPARFIRFAEGQSLSLEMDSRSRFVSEKTRAAFQAYCFAVYQ